MQIAIDPIEVSCPEADIYNRHLQLDDRHILELGCGAAVMTRDIATGGRNRTVTALEVDEIAHASNLRIDDLPNVTFILAGAEDIPLDAASVDVVMMFKSLHHVPVDAMDQALREIHRVLKPGGMAYISEPIYTGAFNDILRMFHDEREVRQAAFAALQRAVDAGLFESVGQVFFNSPGYFADFAEFKDRVIGATHTEHRLDAELLARVKARFEQHMGDDGVHFLQPVRVDLLSKR